MNILHRKFLAKGLALVRGIFSGLVQKKGEFDKKDIATPMNILHIRFLAKGLALVRGIFSGLVQKKGEFDKKGFTMVELVFVIVILGILASVGGNLLPDNRLLNDVNMLTMKLKEKQNNAIGNTSYKQGQDFWSNEGTHNCLKLSKSAILKDEKKRQESYRFNSDIQINETNSTICFDMYGRPYNSAQLLLEKLDINVTLEDKTKQISVLPMSGYVIMKN